MPAQLQPHTPTNHNQILADKSPTKWANGSDHSHPRKETSYSRTHGKEKFRRKQNERSVREQGLPYQGTKRLTRFRRMIATPRQWRRGGRGNADARSWLDLDRGRVVHAVAGRETVASRAEPTGTGSFPVACRGWTRLVASEWRRKPTTHARTHDGPIQTRIWAHVS